MIGYITGSLREIDNGQGLILTSAGVGYIVALPQQLWSSTVPADVSLYTYLYVREDLLALYGFNSKQDYALFQLFFSISGVGPKLSFHIVNSTDYETCVQAVHAQDVSFFQNISGVGKKTAMKIIMELAHKIDDAYILPKLQKVDNELIEALQSLGYRATDIRAITAKLEDCTSLEEKITKGIRLLSASGV